MDGVAPIDRFFFVAISEQARFQKSLLDFFVARLRNDNTRAVYHPTTERAKKPKQASNNLD